MLWRFSLWACWQLRRRFRCSFGLPRGSFGVLGEPRKQGNGRCPLLWYFLYVFLKLLEPQFVSIVGEFASIGTLAGSLENLQKVATGVAPHLAFSRGPSEALEVRRQMGRREDEGR